MHATSHIPAHELAPAQRGLSWLLSAVVHMSLFLVAALAWHPAPRSVAVEADRSAGIVLVDLTASRPEYYPPSDEQTADSEPTNASQSETVGTAAAAGAGENGVVGALPGAEASPLDVASVLPRREALVGPLGGGGGLPSATGLLGAAGGNAAKTAGAGIGRPTQTYVFGIPGVGSKFVYVFDRSASMSGYNSRPLAAAKRELIKSLRSLESTHQFQIVFYNHQPKVFNPLYPQRPRMIFGDDANKQRAERWIAGISADGGTDHLQALQLALGLGPDVVFFLTDADDPQLSEADLARIARWNRGSVINAIEFGAGGRSNSFNFLVRLARQNGGQHTYVDVTQLPLRDDP